VLWARLGERRENYRFLSELNAFETVSNLIFGFQADARRTSALVTEWSQNWGRPAKLSYPMKEDVKEKILPSPLGGETDGDLHPALFSFREGFLFCRLGSPRIPAASQPQLSQLDGFMKQWRSTPSAPEATQAKRWLKCQPRSYVRLEAYSFLGLSGRA